MKRNIDSGHDHVLAGLARLEPDPRRAVRTRQRCRAILERRASKAASPGGIANPRRARAIAGAVLRTTLVYACCLLCVVYALALVFTTASLQVPSR